MIHQSEKVDQLVPALCKAWANLSHAELTKTNPHFKSRYSDIKAVSDAIRSAFGPQGLALIHFPAINEDGKQVLLPTIMHSSGQYIQGEWMLTPQKQTEQAIGSATSYGRRYSAQCMTFLPPGEGTPEQDDDGNAATAGEKKPVNKGTKQPPSPKQGTPPKEEKKKSNPNMARVSKGMSVINAALAAEWGDEELAKRTITDKVIKAWGKVFLDGKSRSEWTKADADRCADSFLKPIQAKLVAGKDTLSDVQELLALG